MSGYSGYPLKFRNELRYKLKNKRIKWQKLQTIMSLSQMLGS